MSFTEVNQKDDSVELTDSDYPPVYGEPVFERSKIDLPSEESIIEAITEKKGNSTALVDNKDVSKILKKENYKITDEDVEFLNTFPSPMDAFQYALYSFGQTDFYIVLMINIRQKSIYGYHVLDLTQQYSLADDLVNRLKNKDFIV